MDTLSFHISSEDTVPVPSWTARGRDWLWNHVLQADSAGEEWADDWHQSPVLTDMLTGELGVFPRLRRVWSEVSDLTLHESQAYLQRRLRDEQSTLDLLGIRVNEDSAILVAVPGFLGLLFVMLAHLKHLEFRLEKGSPKENGLAPILIFLPSDLSQIISVVTIVILPAVALIGLFIRVEPDLSMPWIRFALYSGAVVALLAASLSTVDTIDGLRNKYGFEEEEVETVSDHT